MAACVHHAAPPSHCAPSHRSARCDGMRRARRCTMQPLQCSYRCAYVAGYDVDGAVGGQRGAHANAAAAPMMMTGRSVRRSPVFTTSLVAAP